MSILQYVEHHAMSSAGYVKQTSKKIKSIVQPDYVLLYFAVGNCFIKLTTLGGANNWLRYYPPPPPTKKKFDSVSVGWSRRIAALFKVKLLNPSLQISTVVNMMFKVKSFRSFFKTQLLFEAGLAVIPDYVQTEHELPR